MSTNLHEKSGDVAVDSDGGSSTTLSGRGLGVMARRPAVGAVVFIIIGICVAPRLAVVPGALLGIAGLAAIGAMWSRRSAVVASVLIGVGLAALGAAVAQESTYLYRADAIGAFSSAGAKLAQVELRIEEPPRLVGGGVRGPGRQMFEGRVQRILTGAGWITASGTILVQVTHPHPFLGWGQVVRVLGMLDRPGHATNPGEFDWAEYYREERILTSIKIGQISNIQILSDEGPGVNGIKL